jgi:acetyl-CoA carboxylase carboxyl transferase subunit beta
VDPLQFAANTTYASKLEQSVAQTGYKEAISCGTALVGSHRVGLGVMDFHFLAATMGSVVGEKVARLFERCSADRLPVVISCASGGARVQEGVFSLMQMAKTSAAIARHGESGLAYVALLTHPTTAGVMASFATLGDLILAEAGAMIGFTGPRVIKETTQQELPPGFQRAEFLQEHGLIDYVVDRRDLKATLVAVLGYLDRANGSPPP